MIWWDRQITSIAENLGINIHMYQRYVDDINVVMEAPELGTRYSNGKLTVVEEEKERDRRRKPDERSMSLIRSIGNSIHESIEITVDYASNHKDGRLPILDLKVWIEERELDSDEGKIKWKCVLHEFYSKEIASKHLINARSAMSWSTKRTILTQEVLRVIRNCSPELPWDTTIQHLNNMTMRMQYSGYPKKFRYEVIASALKAYKDIVEKDRTGEKPMYRPKEYEREKRDEDKRRKRKNWYKKDGYNSVIFVPSTPNSELKKKLEGDIRMSGIKIKVVERAGTNVKKTLQRSNPFRENECGKNDCIVCNTGGRGPCHALNVVYKIECKECDMGYIGETSRNAYSRGREHLRDLDCRNERSVLWKHTKDEHQGRVPDFKCSVVECFERDSLLRQISESVLINKDKPEMNNKSEWNFVNIPRAKLE